MLQRSEGLADLTEQHLRGKQGIGPHVSGRSFNQLTQLAHLSHLDSYHLGGSQKITTLLSLGGIGRLNFYIGTVDIAHLSNGFIFC
jgi:hypothetical protein